MIHMYVRPIIRYCCVCSVYGGKTSTPRTAERTKGRRNVNCSTPVVTTTVARQQNSLDLTIDEASLSLYSTPPSGPTPDHTPSSVQQCTNSSQLSASAVGSVGGSGGVASSSEPESGSKLEGPVPTDMMQPPDVVDLAPAVPGVSSVTPRTDHQQQVDRSLGSIDPPAPSTVVDRSGLVSDVQSQSVHRRRSRWEIGRPLGRVRRVQLSVILLQYKRLWIFVVLQNCALSSSFLKIFLLSAFLQNFL